jgi:hypothetical protein
MLCTVNRRRVGALVFALALLTGACGGGGGNEQKTAAELTNRATTSTDASSDSTLDAGSPTTTAVGAGTNSATTKKGGAPAAAANAGGGSGATPAPSADPNAVPGPAKVGTYGYAQSGTTPDGPVPPNGTLVVSGGPTQTFNRYYDPNQAPLVLTYDFRANGPYITGARMSARGATITCAFGNGVPVPPWPPTPGKTFNGSGTCASPIGQLTATISGSVTSRSGDIVGIATNVHANNAANSVNVTLHDTEQWSMSLRVPKASHQTFEGSAFNQPVTGDVSSTLTSTP